MVSAQLLYKLHKFLCVLHPAKADLKFAGMHIAVFGDFGQLPPIATEVPVFSRAMTTGTIPRKAELKSASTRLAECGYGADSISS